MKAPIRTGALKGFRIPSRAPLFPAPAPHSKATVARKRPDFAQQTRAFEQLDPRIAGAWFTPILASPNNAILRQLEPLRATARLLAQTNVYAARYLRLLPTYIVGEGGFQLDPRITKARGTLDDSINSAIKQAWAEWANTAMSDGRSFHTLEQIAIRKTARDGECFIRLSYDVRNGLRLSIIDAAFVDHTYSVMNEATGNQVIQGIEYQGMTPVAYYLRNRYGDDERYAGVKNELERVPADDMIHLFVDDEGTGVRGLTWLQPAIVRLAQLDEYLEANLLTAQLGARAPLWIENTQDDETESLILEDSEESPEYNADLIQNVAGIVNGNDNPWIDAGNGVKILDVPYGKKINKVEVGNQQQSIKDQVHTYLTGIASALSVSYSTLSGDISQESYSSGRLGSILERDHWKNVQAWFSQSLHRKVYTQWLRYAVNDGTLDLPGTDLTRYLKVSWRARGFKWVDPLKDIKAYLEGIAAGIYTYSQVVHEMGGEWKENMRTLAAEKEFAASLGIKLPTIVNDKETVDASDTTTPINGAAKPAPVTTTTTSTTPTANAQQAAGSDAQGEPADNEEE